MNLGCKDRISGLNNLFKSGRCFGSLCVIIICSAISSKVHAQLGVSVAYNKVLETGDLTDDKDISVAVDYWFRLKTKRIEFQPEFYYAFADYGYLTQRMGGLLKMNIYPLDFTGDCDCPTFSKSGATFKKGWFLQTGFGVQYINREVYGDHQTQWKFMLGTGVDFGLSNYLTLTPYVQYQMHNKIELSNQLELNLNTINIGLRTMIRFDGKNYSFNPNPKGRRRKRR